MPLSSSTLIKKTKAEIVAEYEKLLKNFEEAKQLSMDVHEPRSQKLIEKSKEKTSEQAHNAIGQLRKVADGSINGLAEVLLTEVQCLDELREMVTVLEKELETYNNIKVAADTLDSLVSEHELKKQQFAVRSEQRKDELEAELADKNRQWEREHEEKEYEVKRKRRREGAEIAEEQARRGGELDEREEQLDERETELSTLREQTEQFPDKLDKQLERREKEVVSRLEGEVSVAMDRAKQEWEAQQQVLQLKMANLEEQIKAQQKEATALRQEAERSNKRAQDLAVSIIKSGRNEGAVEQKKEDTLVAGR